MNYSMTVTIIRHAVYNRITFVVAIGVLMLATSFTNAWAQDRPSIALHGNIVTERASGEYTDLNGIPTVFGQDNRETTGLTARTATLQPKDGRTDVSPMETLRMEAKGPEGGGRYGMKATHRFTLPEGRFYQLQGSGRVFEGSDNGADIGIEFYSRKGKDEFQLMGQLKGVSINNDEFDGNWEIFVADLSDLAGMETEMVLTLQADASYAKVGDQDVVTPSRISADWDQLKIVDSSFRVIVGDEEKVNTNQAKTLRRGITPKMEFGSLFSNTGVENRVLRSKYDLEEDFYLSNPGESGVNTAYIPAFNNTTARWVGYFTTPLMPSATENKDAGARMFDFAFSSDTSNNLYDATIAEATVSVYRTSGGAIGVLNPGSLYDEAWPGHIAIACAVPTSTTASNPMLHAFVHCEDAYREDAYGNPLSKEDSHLTVYEYINYARSYPGSDCGRVFSKMYTTEGQINHHIITFEIEEDDLGFNDGYWPDSKMFGCGSPSVIKKDGYYYMLYHVRTMHNFGTLANPIIIDPSTGLYVPRQSFAIARASVSDIEHAEYEDRVNYWKKFKEIATPWSNGANWVEPGIGGEESILFNALLDGNGYRTKWIADANWRGFIKVSHNSWAAGFDEMGDYMMICQGRVTGSSAGVYIHNSDNLIDWTDYGILVWADNGSVKKNYPTLIGDTGSSTETSLYNMMYYQRYYFDDNKYRYDLYRQTFYFDY